MIETGHRCCTEGFECCSQFPDHKLGLGYVRRYGFVYYPPEVQQTTESHNANNRKYFIRPS